LPQDDRFNRIFRYVTLETGLVVGGLFMALGLVASIVAVEYWKRMGFGPVDPAKTLRLVTPGVVCLTLGFQTVLSSFFLSILGMARR